MKFSTPGVKKVARLFVALPFLLFVNSQAFVRPSVALLHTVVSLRMDSFILGSVCWAIFITYSANAYVFMQVVNKIK